MTIRIRRILQISACLAALSLGACGSDADEPDRGGEDGGEEGGGDDGGDGDGDDDAPSLEACLAGVSAQETPTELLTFEANGTAVAVVRYVEEGKLGTSGSVKWLPERFAFARGSGSVCITDASKLEYVSTYHNFDDKLAAEAGERTFYWHQQRSGYGATQFTVSASGSRPVKTIALKLLSCRVLNDDSDCSDFYAGSLDSDAGSDGESEPDSVSVEACAAEAAEQDTYTERLMFRAEGLAVALVRYADPELGNAAGTTAWLAERFALATADHSECITDPESFVYTHSHHNYDDKLEVVSGHRTYTFTQKLLDFTSPFEWTVSIKEGAKEVRAPTPLTLESCTLLNSDSDCSAGYLFE